MKIKLQRQEDIVVFTVSQGKYTVKSYFNILELKQYSGSVLCLIRDEIKLLKLQIWDRIYSDKEDVTAEDTLDAVMRKKRLIREDEKKQVKFLKQLGVTK